MHADDLLAPLSSQTMGLLPPVALFDAHTHIGVNDPDGFKCTSEQLLATLELSGARAVTFPMHEPDGYSAANDHVIAASAASDGRLVAFCRVDPRDDPAAEIRRCFAAGARGIKLHPRAEQFGLDEPGVREIVAFAHDERLAILVHAGRGIPALGAHILQYATEFPRARFILAHAGVCDLAWIWQHAAGHPNVFFDTAWFSTADLLALCALVPPGQILFASDIPFGTPVQSVIVVLRCALQAGLGPDQLACVAGEQLARIVAGEETLDVGRAPGPAGVRSDPLLARAGYFAQNAFAIVLAGGDPGESIDLARLACNVGEGAPQEAHCAVVLDLLDLALTLPHGETLMERFTQIHLLIAATAIAATPDVPLRAR